MKVLRKVATITLVFCLLLAGCGEMKHGEVYDKTEFVRIQAWDGAERFDYVDFQAREIDLESEGYLLGIDCDPSLIEEFANPDDEFNGSIVISLPYIIMDGEQAELNVSLNLASTYESGQIGKTLLLNNLLDHAVSFQPTFFYDNVSTPYIEAMCVDAHGYEEMVEVQTVALSDMILVTIPIDDISSPRPKTVYLRWVAKIRS